MDSPYVDWLRRQGTRLFEGGGAFWRLYRGALVPATAAPCFLDVPPAETRRLLRDSGAWLLRYSSEPSVESTPWWFVLCDRYDAGALSSKTRNEIGRSRRECTVRLLDPAALAETGYECYRSAFGRYAGARPIPEEEWRADILQASGGPFEFWGVFVQSRLAGYARCILEGTNVATSAIRLDPQYLKDRVSYALVSHLLGHYVGEGGRTVSNGNRSVAHETNFQDFLLKFGFRRQYCRLRIAYRDVLAAAVFALYPFRSLVGRTRGSGATARVRALLAQEEWRRESGGAGRPA